MDVVETNVVVVFCRAVEPNSQVSGDHVSGGTRPTDEDIPRWFVSSTTTKTSIGCAMDDQEHGSVASCCAINL